MPFENINGINVYYESHGKGGEKGTILLLHHGFGCVKTWEEIYPGLVDEGYRVIMYDRRGYGRSEKGPDFMDFYVSDGFRTEGVEEMAVLPGCGHNTYQYRPEDYVRIVLDFLQRHEKNDGGMTAEMLGMSCLAVKKPLENSPTSR